ncbi:MAG TPA: serine/threonine-protein kinase [Acidobacteriaceae bacterium]
MPEIGQFFGPYEIRGQLGAGGMGTVLRAYDPRLHREVAIKILNANFEEAGVRARFLREARAASALNHPHIATIFDIGEHDGKPYMVMELLEGETLRERIERGALQMEEIVAVGVQTAEALTEAHSKGVVHRDIKPANIFLVQTASGATCVKILDFGLAKIDLSASVTRVDLTAAGSAVGTVAYMSPEQARGESLDGRSDIFSLGTVLYEMATGQVPFNGATSALVFVGLLSRDPEPIRDWNRAVPKVLEKIVLKALEKVRADRYQTPEELKIALARVKTRKGWFSRRFSAPAVIPHERNNDPVARDRREVSRQSAQIRAVTRQDVKWIPSAPGSKLESVAHAVASASAANEPEEAAEPIAEPHYENAASFHGSGENRELAEVMRRDTPGARLRRERRRKMVYALAVVLVVTGIVIGGWIYYAKHRPRPVLQAGDGVLVGVIVNRTGNSLLDQGLRQAVAIELDNAGYFSVLSDEQLKAGLGKDHEFDALTPERVRPIAISYGAKVYIAGYVEQANGKFTLGLSAINSEAGVTVASVQEESPDLDHLIDAMDRATERLRAALGEPQKNIAATHVDFRQAATASWVALSAYAYAERFMAEGDPVTAALLYQNATAADPDFALAYMRLADASEAIHAEGDAAQYAARAFALSGKLSARQKLYAAFANDLYAGAWDKAQEVLGVLNGLGESGTALQLRAARLNAATGNYNEAFNAAQQAGGQHPYTASTYAQTGAALIGLGRFETAEQMAQQGERNGFAQPGLLLTTAYLQGEQDAVARLTMRIGNSNDLAGKMEYGLYLDNTGQWRLAQQVWRGAAKLAQQRSLGDEAPGKLNDVAVNLLAQGAYDRALANECEGTVAMAQEALDVRGSTPASQRTQFHIAMSETMCGEASTAEAMTSDLATAFPASVPVQKFYVPELRAAAMIRAGDATGALATLENVRQYDAVSIVMYLRAVAYMRAHQTQLAVVDFQQVLEHRGPAYLGRAPVYALAQAGLGAAFAEMGDVESSNAAYRAFLQNWKSADADQPLLREAKEHAGTAR